ncbi:MAG: TylF/MycF/NovP-related O-methyltransferase [bacterium]
MRIRTVLKKLFNYLSDLYLILKFTFNKAGKEYGISRFQKFKLVGKIRRNNKKVVSGSTWHQHLLMVEDILKVPMSLNGDVVECGCYKGACTVNLSLACALTDRRLLVCDSFEGLPAPKDGEEYDIHGRSVNYYVWEKGELSAQLDLVKKNVEKFGNIHACHFYKGYFNETLKNIDTDSVVMVFEDADLKSSVEDCLQHLWPKLQEGCKFYCHEPWSIHVVSLFFDKAWWQTHLKTSPPGFYGSGHGIIAGLNYSNIGYALKFDAQKIREQGIKIIHHGSKGFEE